MKTLPVMILLFLALNLSPPPANAQEGLKSIGIRSGISAKKKHEYFHQYEMFTEYGLPWDWRGDSGWGLGVKLDASAGALYGGKAIGFIGTLGPGFSFSKGNRGFAADIGSSLVILNKRNFGTQNFAGKLQFLIYLGLNYRFDNGLGLGYRIQHMSNAGLYNSVNPGLDLHMAAISWNF
ncbi:[lipopolysaccharide]-lipid A 3-O-deacylase outer membrane protein, PagL family [Geotalea daltonii FRC-32]|uniref:[lipopolysaccharide]-lipid A 3-O-deacylase outer membrane protein, PagL family n=1 Tax=Geotalea daltonii (strain DSM 22248 / JCM 15807 / FRC-32) TaxID=316067 RepID=B9M6D6_GEODF|nr:acyloxyacyl hydrolase [Geotalea daltonii]ACM21924.1 [lipopolysaccharide]-lipid A 3-O-deacylase outer membrane protein, PagL family [Geotalea daltonii FRC-32]